MDAPNIQRTCSRDSVRKRKQTTLHKLRQLTLESAPAICPDCCTVPCADLQSLSPRIAQAAASMLDVRRDILFLLQIQALPSLT